MWAFPCFRILRRVRQLGVPASLGVRDPACGRRQARADSRIERASRIVRGREVKGRWSWKAPETANPVLLLTCQTWLGRSLFWLGKSFDPLDNDVISAACQQEQIHLLQVVQDLQVKMPGSTPENGEPAISNTYLSSFAPKANQLCLTLHLPSLFVFICSQVSEKVEHLLSGLSGSKVVRVRV